MTTIKNRPSAVTVGLLVVVVGHVAAAHVWAWVPSPSRLLGSNDDAWGLYAAAAGAIAVVGGFTGVLVVFAMTNNEVFAKMRLKGGASLEANWLSPVASSLGATLLAVVAAASALSGHGSFGAWTFELGLLVGIHAALRLLWLLSHLVTAVRRQDEQDASDRNALSFDQIVGSGMHS